MTQEGKFWVSIWAIVGVVVLGVFALLTLNSYERRLKWAEAVANGADPMVVSCALFEQTSAEQVTCALLAQNRK